MTYSKLGKKWVMRYNAIFLVWVYRLHAKYSNLKLTTFREKWWFNLEMNSLIYTCTTLVAIEITSKHMNMHKGL